jgi:5-carboxymethyl-2-hydroxymuconate isomerase
MPHCILEYSANVVDTPDVAGLLRELHQRLAATGQFKLEDLKSRAIRHEAFAVGDGDPNRAFIALEICIFGGRDSATKRRIAEPATELLRAAFPRTLQERQCSITVRVSDIDRDSYQRIGNI